jgi:hypothetical protein
MVSTAMATCAPVAINSAFMLIEFDEPLAPDTVYLETHAGGRYVEERHDQRIPQNVRRHPGSVRTDPGVQTMNATPDPPKWVKASRSGNQGSCVEMRQHSNAVEVRDTKDSGDGPTLRFTASEFAAWVDGAKRGEFDHLFSVGEQVVLADRRNELVHELSAVGAGRRSEQRCAPCARPGRSSESRYSGADAQGTT